VSSGISRGVTPAPLTISPGHLGNPPVAEGVEIVNARGVFETIKDPAAFSQVRRAITLELLISTSFPTSTDIS
jgi:hypothetical protein